MKLFLIRHGQSSNNQLYFATGSTDGRNSDPELTELGVRQARLLGEYIRRLDEKYAPGGELSETAWRDLFGFTHLYTSLMVRAVNTAVILAGVIGLPAMAWIDIHETGGIYLDDETTGEPRGLPGRNRAYFEQRFPQLALPDTLDEKGWWNRPFELQPQRVERAQRVLEDLQARHGRTGARVALVTHGSFSNYLLHAIFGGDPQITLWPMNNTAVTRVDFMPGGRTRLAYHNRSEHLPEELLT